MTFPARYRGHCDADCGSPIEVGEEIEYRAGRLPGTRILVHVVCPPSVPKKRAALCPTCFLELPLTGVCDGCS